MCRANGRRCPSQDNPTHRQVYNAHRRITRNTERAQAARERGDETAAARYDALADTARAQADALTGTHGQGGTDAPERVSTASTVPAVEPQQDTQEGTGAHPLANGPADPVEFQFMRNPVSLASNQAGGHDFGQDLEPAGRYMSESSGFTPEGWQSGTVTFTRPLRIDFGSMDYSDESNWKRRLSAHYGGATGKALSRKVRKDGYDAIITSDKYGTSEVVDLTGIKP